MVVVVTGTDWWWWWWWCGTMVGPPGPASTQYQSVLASVGQQPALLSVSSLLSALSPVTSLYTVGHPHHQTELRTPRGWSEKPLGFNLVF